MIECPDCGVLISRDAACAACVERLTAVVAPARVAGAAALRAASNVAFATPTSCQIDTDGTTVWVNSAEGCLARFGVNGIDIHRTLTEQLAGRSDCLQCTHALTIAEDWEAFKDGMAKHYNIVVTDEHKPQRFR